MSQAGQQKMCMRLPAGRCMPQGCRLRVQIGRSSDRTILLTGMFTLASATAYNAK